MAAFHVRTADFAEGAKVDVWGRIFLTYLWGVSVRNVAVRLLDSHTIKYSVLYVLSLFAFFYYTLLFDCGFDRVLWFVVCVIHHGRLSSMLSWRIDNKSSTSGICEYSHFYAG